MKILHLANGLDIGAKSGGAAHFAAELSRQQRAGGHDVSLGALYRFETTAEKHWEEQLRSAGVSVHFLNPGSRLRPAAAMGRLRALIANERIDILHSHTPVGSLLAALAPRGKARVVRTEHTPVPWGDSALGWISRQLFTGLLFAAFIDQEAGVSPAISAMLDRRLASWLLKRRAVTIPPILPEHFLACEPKPVREDPAAGYVIGSVGVLRKIKAYDVLIRAMPEVLAQFSTARLLLAGGGEERERLEGLAAGLDISDAVHFLGPVQDAAAVLDQLDLFVLPSRVEGLPMVILESRACGVPVVAADIPGTRALITPGTNGWLVPPGDSRALAETICRVLADAPAREQAREQSRRGLERYSAAAVAQAYEQLYQQIRV